MAMEAFSNGLLSAIWKRQNTHRKYFSKTTCADSLYIIASGINFVAMLVSKKYFGFH